MSLIDQILLLVSLHHRLNNFDLIRLCAAAQVAVIHAAEALHVGSSPLLKWVGLFPGVPIFFFVSGFLVAQSLERTRSLTAFYRNRFLRVFPALWACFAFSLALVALFKPLPWVYPEFPAWLAAQMTFVQFYNPDFMRDFGLGVLNGSLWTIPVELQFYLALPILFLLVRRLGISLLWTVTGVSLIAHGVFQAFLYGDDTFAAKLIQVTLAPWLGFFLIGALASHLWPHVQNQFRGRALAWVGVYAIVASLALVVLGDGITGNRLPAPLAVLLFGAVLSTAYTAPQLSTSLLRGSDISYGLYLFHAPLINAYLEATERGWIVIPPNMGLTAILMSTILLALLSWFFVERPALGLKTITFRPAPNTRSASPGETL